MGAIFQLRIQGRKVLRKIVASENSPVSLKKIRNFEKVENIIEIASIPVKV
jgi:hypothetical protein